MAYSQVRPFQLYEQKFMDQRFPMKYHIENMFKKNPVYASQLVERMFSTNYNTDIINEMNQYPTHVVDDQVYRWMGVGMTDKNIALIAAWEDSYGTTPAGTTTPYIGTDGNSFFLDFAEKWFGVGQHIVGMNPNKYRVWIVEQPVMVTTNVWRYKCQLVGAEGTYIPKEELSAGTRWSGDGGLTADIFSKEGYGTTFTAPFEFENRMSQFRMGIKVPTNIYREGKLDNVYVFQFADNQGNVHKIWFDMYWKNFLLDCRASRAKKFLFDKSNKAADGNTINRDPITGQAASEGSGLYELLDAGSVHPYHADDLSSSFISNIILDNSVGRVEEAGRSVTIMCGEYGYKRLSEMMRKELIFQYAPTFLGDTTGRSISWEGNNVKVNLGQVVSVASFNGINFKFMKAPHKDDPIRNKKMYPGGEGRISSHEFDILDFGMQTNGKPNIQKVELRDNPERFWVQPGIGSKFLGNGSESAPMVAYTDTDVDVYHYMASIGAIVWNPTRNIRLIPSMLY